MILAPLQLAMGSVGRLKCVACGALSLNGLSVTLLRISEAAPQPAQLLG